jgi:spore coat protein U-like protein
MSSGAFMNKYFKVALVVGALTAAGAASAATTTGNLAVSATVATNCLINSATMPFLTYTPGNGNLDVSGSIVVRCTNGMPYAIGLGAGLAPGATELTRSMQNGAALLSYQLFKDAPRTLNWGQTLAGDRLAGLTGSGMGVTNTHTIYGRIPDSGANLLAAAGAFADTVLVTVTY